MPATDPATIKAAAAAAAAAHKAAAEAQANEAKSIAIEKAKQRLTGFLDVWLDPSVLTYEFREGSVIASDEAASLAVKPDQSVWVSQLGADGQWTALCEVQSLLEVADVLKVG